MKKLSKLLTFILSLVMCGSIFVGCNTTSADLSGYVAVDINPSIELITDKDGLVIEVHAVNEDAQILLSDKSLIGLELSVALEWITDECEAMGYINDSNTDVSITIDAKTDKAIKELKARAEKGAKKGCDFIKLQADEIRQAIDQKVEELKAENPELYEGLTAAKLKIINSIMEYDRSFTVEVGVTMTTEELIDMLKDYMEEYSDFVSEEIEHEFEKKFDELAANVWAQIEGKIAEFIGNAEYSVKAALVRQLELLEDMFEHELNHERPGHHFHFDRDFDDDESDDLALTTDMKAELAVVINDQMVLDAIVTIEDLDDYIDGLEDEIEEMFENFEFTPEQLQIIEGLKAQLHGFKQAAKEFVNTTMQGIKTQLQFRKQMIKNGFGK
ncbi:MAG: hypothetical protein E7369_01710 [Clostridiales bacterium]|nr:hypothetical protein [Clostridiales bacterium]